jgi:hypothetical protein
LVGSLFRWLVGWLVSWLVGLLGLLGLLVRTTNKNRTKFMLQLTQGEVRKFFRIRFHVSVVATFLLQEQVPYALTVCHYRLYNTITIKERNNDISVFNFHVIQSSQNPTNTSSQSGTQLQTIPILHTDISMFVKRHFPENSDIQQHA